MAVFAFLMHMLLSIRGLVVCPEKRQTKLRAFSETRKSFRKHGLRVTRCGGVDRKNPPRGFLASDLKPAAMLSAYMEKAWLSLAKRVSTRTSCSHILWVEDDCQLLPGFSLESFLQEIKQAGSRPLWAGYYPRGAGKKPTWGSHLVFFLHWAASLL